MVVAAAVALVVVGGTSIWLVLRPKQSDCAVVNDMLDYSKSENDRMRKLIPVSADDPQKVVDAYQNREDRMHHYVDSIRDAGLRQKAYALVNLDDQMLNVWRGTIPDQSPSNAASDSATSSQDLRSAYAKYSPQRQKAAEALQAACPVS
jgi:carboxylesterase type B